jgi:hypothetical protein
MEKGKLLFVNKITTLRQKLFIWQLFTEKICVHFVGQCGIKENFKKYIRKASVELWRTKAPHSTIRS